MEGCVPDSETEPENPDEDWSGVSGTGYCNGV